MVQMIQLTDMVSQMSQSANRTQVKDNVQSSDSFASVLRAAQKPEKKIDQSSDKTSDVSDKNGKATKDKKKPVESASPAAAQNSAQPVPPQPVQQNVQPAVSGSVPQVQAAAANPVNPAAVPAQQIPLQPQNPQTAQQPLQTADAAVVSTQGQTAPQAVEPQTAQNIPQPVEQLPEPDAKTVQPTADSGSPKITDLTRTPAQPSTASSSTPKEQDASQTAPQAAFTVEAKTETVRQKDPAQTSKMPSSQPLSDFYTGGKVIVKVSDAPAAAKIPVSNQISNAVTDGLKTGKQQLQVSLYPQSLGKVTVKLASENGILTVEIAASDPKTQSLLASSSGEIRSMLHDSTGQTVQVTAQQGTQQSAQQYAGQNGNQAQQQAANQQQQKEEARQREAQWYAAGNSSGFSAGDFLTALQQAAV